MFPDFESGLRAALADLPRAAEVTRAEVEALCARADAERDVVASAKRWHEARQSGPMGSVIDAEVALAAAVETLNALTPAGPRDGGS